MRLSITTFFVLALFSCATLTVFAQDDTTDKPRKENPNNLDARATMLTRSGNFREAAEAYVKLIKLYPKDPELYVNLSRCRLETREYAEAVKAARVAVSLSPRDYAARNSLGWGLASLGQTEEGVIELKAAAGLNPDSERVRTNLGLVLLKLGRDKEAIVELQAALAIDNFSVRARLALAFAYERAGKYLLARADHGTSISAVNCTNAVISSVPGSIGV
jgi:tetratricopeptide (TPR) repeat protein